MVRVLCYFSVRWRTAKGSVGERLSFEAASYAMGEPPSVTTLAPSRGISMSGVYALTSLKYYVRRRPRRGGVANGAAHCIAQSVARRDKDLAASAMVSRRSVI